MANCQQSCLQVELCYSKKCLFKTQSISFDIGYIIDKEQLSRLSKQILLYFTKSSYYVTIKLTKSIKIKHLHDSKTMSISTHDF